MRRWWRCAPFPLHALPDVILRVQHLSYIGEHGSCQLQEVLPQLGVAALFNLVAVFRQPRQYEVLGEIEGLAGQGVDLIVVIGSFHLAEQMSKELKLNAQSPMWAWRRSTVMARMRTYTVSWMGMFTTEGMVEAPDEMKTDSGKYVIRSRELPLKAK